MQDERALTGGQHHANIRRMGLQVTFWARQFRQGLDAMPFSLCDKSVDAQMERRAFKGRFPSWCYDKEQ